MAHIVFVSGASGFVGHAVVRELLGRDYRVHALVHRRPLPIRDARITTFQGELDNPTVLSQALERTTAAIHLVGIIAERPSANITFHRLHIDFTRALVDACVRQNVRRYIHMSALGGRSDSPSLYHQTKAAAEAIVEASPLAWTIFRPSLILGPDGEFTRMLEAWARHRKAPWLFMPYFGAGLLGAGRKSLIQPVGVNDVARAFVDAIDLPASENRRFDLVGPERFTWPGLYRSVAEQLVGHPAPTFPIPAWYALLLTRLLPARLLPFNRAQVLMSQEDSTADPAPFAQTFGFTPSAFCLPPL